MKTSPSQCTPTPVSLAQQKAIIIGILHDFASDADTLFRYLAHAGFDVRCVGNSKELQAAWLGHYRLKTGAYDVDRACNDLATWPPIASRLFALQREKMQ